MRRIRCIYALLVLFAVSGCAKPFIAPDILFDRGEVISLVNSSTPVKCAFKGRVVLTVKEKNEFTSVPAIIDKSCNSNFSAKLIGPFGSLLADISYKDGVITAKHNGKDITDDLDEMYIDLGYISASFVMPPVILDDSFAMTSHINGYYFRKEDINVYVTRDFYIRAVIKNDISFYYDWNRGSLLGIKIKNIDGEVDMEFKEPWVK